MASGTRDYAKNNKHGNNRRAVTKADSRAWIGASFITAGLIGLFIFGLFHLHAVPRTGVHKTANAVKKEAIIVSQHSGINKPRFEFYSILSQSEVAATTGQHTVVPSHPVSTVASTPPPPTATLSHAKDSSKKYILQVAALKNNADVDRLKAQLTAMGYNVQIQQFDNHGSVWRRVSLGPYANQAKAEEEQLKLKAHHFISILRVSHG